MMSKTIKVITIATLIIAFLKMLNGCGQYEIEDKAPKPPRGYPNFTFLKAAAAIGLVKLVDLKPDIPEEIEVFKDIEYKNVEEKLLKLDIYK